MNIINKNENNLKVIGDKILVKKISQNKFGNLLLIDNTDNYLKGIICGLGQGRRDSQGQFLPFQIKTGDKILFAKYKGYEIRIEEENYVVITEDDIIAIDNSNINEK